jgi:hypothetical protein
MVVVHISNTILRMILMVVVVVVVVRDITGRTTTFDGNDTVVIGMMVMECGHPYTGNITTTTTVG